MDISYNKKTKKYILGGIEYSKEAFISFIQGDMLQTALATKSGSFDIEEYTPAAISGGQNIIITGAPGTGKSHDINTKYPNAIRCVFHNDYTNSDFVGMYKPVSVDSSTESSITYKFIPGPFTDAVTAAYNNPDSMHTLIIEEINRADASAVFGELFQLLDRRDDGVSEYFITVSNEIQRYYNQELTNDSDSLVEDIKLNGRLRLPPNLNIIATMNTSDQGVFTLDTAFKRRWIFKFMDINFAKCDYKDTLIEICGKKISWEDFAKTINSYMMQNNLPEDRQLGQFFLREHELIDENIFASKLLYYLWTDIARYDKNTYFRDITTFSELTQKYKDGDNIFSQTLYDKLNVFFQ